MPIITQNLLSHPRKSQDSTYTVASNTVLHNESFPIKLGSSGKKIVPHLGSTSGG